MEFIHKWLSLGYFLGTVLVGCLRLHISEITDGVQFRWNNIWFISPLYFKYTDIDVWEFRQCVKLSREIFAQEAFDKFRGQEVQPGINVQTDKEIDAFVREKADSAYHPSCTCKMGQPSDPMAVVDPQARVIGVKNLRVVDASIMPSVVSGNLNAPTIMIAEKAADVIKGLPPLHEKNVPVYRAKAQRWMGGENTTMIIHRRYPASDVSFCLTHLQFERLAHQQTGV